MTDYSDFLDFALMLAKEAGKIQLKYFRSNHLVMETKLNSYDVVTQADKESENFIVGAIREKFPDHGIIAEESGSVMTENEYRWVIDPLDGTTNFSQGLPIFNVSIALEHQGKAIVGVVFAPYLNEIFYAAKGNGAFLNGKPISCSKKTDIATAVLSTGFPYDKQINSDNNIKEVAAITPLVRGMRRLGSAAIDICYVASGFLDAFWELNLKRWDVAAGCLIAEEAGAKIESIRENRNHSILVSAPGLFNQMSEILRNIKESGDC